MRSTTCPEPCPIPVSDAGPALTRRRLIRSLGLGVATSAVALRSTARAAEAQEPAAVSIPGVLAIDLPEVVQAVTTGTAAELAAANPVLAAGSQAFALDTTQLWIGDGATPLNDLVAFETPSGVELGSATDGEARSFSNVTVDYPNLTVGPFTIPAGKVGYVHLHLPNCYVTSESTYSAFAIVHGPGSSAPENTSMDDATCLLVGRGLLYTTSDKGTVARVGPGTYTAKVLVYDAPAAGSSEVNFQGTAKARLWVTLG